MKEGVAGPEPAESRQETVAVPAHVGAIEVLRGLPKKRPGRGESRHAR
jgi:hypothetical protein